MTAWVRSEWSSTIVAKQAGKIRSRFGGRCERGGARVTLIELYALVAEPRGLKPHELPLAERRELAGRATPLMWPGFEYNERSQPRERQAVEVVAYDQGWPERF